ncbi:CYTH domain-containing protein [Paenirhodobacter populi]|uniref:CYTH domain-containing protein n=1 Tax=Paenirhodobacter populi TaxID=2306993 RepID=UPI000FE38457|nr:CYTH domain-containing protein [Sinirhodobacter populi]RWR09489.1 CYTH domain-containing protein [Sinirhodobacter populi]
MTVPLEIERKFLVKTAPPLGKLKAVPVRQGYLTSAGDTVEIRVRQMGAAWFLTLKSGGTLTRAEYEVPIDRAQFDTLWPATEGRRIEKTRHTGRLDSGELFELDLFAGAHAGLMLVEVEFPTTAAAQGFVPPDWFGADVTGDGRYKNKALAG